MEPELKQYADLYAELGVPDVSPSWAIITSDCRDKEIIEAVGDMSGKMAIYFGDFYYPEVFRKNFGEPDNIERLHDALCVQPDEYDEDSTFDVGNPLLLTEVGNIIWGLECYWGNLEEDRDFLLKEYGIDIAQFTAKFGADKVFERFKNFLIRTHQRLNSNE